jgi:serine protease inhibitor
MRKDQSLVARLVARLAAGTGAALLAAGLMADAAVATEPDMIAAKMNQLGGKTLAELTGKRGDTTVILSPYGLGAALHLLMLGAALESKGEESLKTVLLPESPKSLDAARDDLKAFNKAVLDTQRNDKVTLRSASAVFVPQPVKVSANFSRKAPDVLKATLQHLDFKSPKALETINTWVKTYTNGEIPSILTKLEPDARFVLLNAVYFKGAWEQAFDPAKTAKAPFTRVDGSQQDVPMMTASLQVAIAELDKLQAVWLPYAGKEVAMVVIAPRADGAPTMVAEALKSKSIDKLVEAAGKEAELRSVHVRLPRFRVESFLDITDALATQIGPALVADADYSPINPAKSGPLLVVHRVAVDVTEAGTVAAAATGITTDRSLQITPMFAADRPFAFAIVHRPTKAILFTGYVADPGAATAGAKGP